MSEPTSASSDPELRAHVERALSAHYELEEELGRGGMGVVYRGKDRRLKRTVAIKILPPELAFRSEIKTRFLREAETAAQLNHPNIVDIYSVDEAESIVFFVMAYIHGDNLAKRLHDHGALGVDETRRILRDVADALAYAHERGVIHRDIKPDNILIDADSGRPMVTDFGIARAVSDSSRLTATGTAIGTPTHMSPEQAAGERQVDGRSDLYSLGVVGYQMLTGEPPFIANSTPAILVKHISELPTPVSQRRRECPDDLARVVMMLLEKDPADRLPSAGAVVAALDGGAIAYDSREYRRPSAAGGDVGTARTSGGTSMPAMFGPPAPLGPPAISPLPSTQSPIPGDAPTYEERQRWENAKVQKFRRQVAPYLYINGVIVMASIVSQSDYLGVTVVWSIWLAYRYAKLWADGYDWRDVFRQPRDRELIDVVEEFLEGVRNLFDRSKRRELREQRRARRLERAALPPLPGESAMPVSSGSRSSADNDTIRIAGAYADRVRRAESDRDEILRRLERMSGNDRSRIPDVGPSAAALAGKVKAMAIALADLDRVAAPNATDQLEAEISQLESAANPLDRAASEGRVRRLATLKRQRRGLADIANRRATLAAKMETCLVALENIKFDLARLNAGGQTHQHITGLAMEALSLADSVDNALYVADEMGRMSGSDAARSSRSGAPR